ncbi:MAG: response regulator [Acidobacteriia bacterium]|nr:response regulator [Terriglobia bacterium]
MQPQSPWQPDFAVLEEAPIPCHELDLEGRIVRVNAAACRLLGIGSEQLLGHHAWEFVVSEERASAHDRILRNMVGAQSPASVERNWIRMDGARLVLEIHTVQIRDPQGRITGLRTFLMDVTARKRAEEALLKAQEGLEHRIQERTSELELANQLLRREIEERHQAEEARRKLEAQVQHAQRLESLGVLAGGIAHDFNNLLASIMGYGSLAAMDLAEGSRARKAIDQVLIAAKSAAGLTQQMLAYSGRGTFILEPVDLTQMIESVVRLLESTVPKKVALQLNLAVGLPCIYADTSQIRQVVMNIITNAAESIGDNLGTVSVTTSAAHYQTAELPASESGEGLPAGEYVCLRVTDTGCGMDAATVSKIFDPFFTTKFTGRGLGLAAVLGIVRSHQGAIQVNSLPGTGTTFRVYFPAVSEVSTPDATRHEWLGSWRQEGLVLVVEDQPSVRDLARLILEEAGLTVLTADDGRHAIEVFLRHAHEIRAVLLDLNMPGMDGAEVLAHIESHAPEVRVVLSSGYNEQDVTAKLNGRRADGFLRKPYHPSELIARFRSIW